MYKTILKFSEDFLKKVLPFFKEEIKGLKRFEDIVTK
jgi:hypothetical protein